MYVTVVLHVFLTCSFLFGFLMIVTEFLMKRTTEFLLSSIAQALLLYVLICFERIDGFTRLMIECEKLKQENDEVANRQQEVEEFYLSIDRFMDCWSYRTNPRLRIMKEIHEQVWDNHQDAVYLLQIVEPGLALIEDTCGSLDMWLSDTMQRPSDYYLKHLRARLEECAEYIRSKGVQAIMQQVPSPFQIILLLNVRVIGCHNLPYGKFFDKIDPSVQVRVESGEWMKTTTIKNEQNPRWDRNGVDTEFKFEMTHENGSILEVQVLDDEDLVGAIILSLTEMEPGKWVKVKQSLPEKGEVELAMFIAKNLKHVVDLAGVAKGAYS